MTAGVQETLAEAMIRPACPRVWIHAGCGGWVLFSIAGGFCLTCHAGPLHPGEYAKPAVIRAGEAA